MSTPATFEPCHCPLCGVDLAGKTLTAEQLGSGFYGDNIDCGDCGRPTHWGRAIGIYSRSRDKTIEWMCPDCGGRWER